MSDRIESMVKFKIKEKEACGYAGAEKQNFKGKGQEFKEIFWNLYDLPGKHPYHCSKKPIVEIHVPFQGLCIRFVALVWFDVVWGDWECSDWSLNNWDDSARPITWGHTKINEGCQSLTTY